MLIANRGRRMELNSLNANKIRPKVRFRISLFDFEISVLEVQLNRMMSQC